MKNEKNAKKILRTGRQKERSEFELQHSKHRIIRFLGRIKFFHFGSQVGKITFNLNG